MKDKSLYIKISCKKMSCFRSSETFFCNKNVHWLPIMCS